MCKNCRVSELAKERQAELQEAEESCKALNLNTVTAGFIARYAYRGGIPKQYAAGTHRFTEDEQAALDRYNAAQVAMKKLHEDYIWGIARAHAAEMKAKGISPLYITHADPQRKEHS